MPRQCLVQWSAAVDCASSSISVSCCSSVSLEMASALVACNGGDDFVRERGGLHYNVRNCCATVCGEDGKPMGVEVLTCYDDSEEEEDDDENNNQKLRYEKPNVEEVHIVPRAPTGASVVQ